MIRIRVYKISSGVGCQVVSGVRVLRRRTDTGLAFGGNMERVLFCSTTGPKIYMENHMEYVGLVDKPT